MKIIDYNLNSIGLPLIEKYYNSVLESHPLSELVVDNSFYVYDYCTGYNEYEEPEYEKILSIDNIGYLILVTAITNMIDAYNKDDKDSKFSSMIHIIEKCVISSKEQYKTQTMAT